MLNGKEDFIQNYYDRCQDYYSRGERSSSISMPNTARTSEDL